MNILLKSALIGLVCGMLAGYVSDASAYDFKDLDAKSKHHVLSVCVYEGDIAGNIQFARQESPEYTEKQHKWVAEKLLRQDEIPEQQITHILGIFDDVWSRFNIHVTPSQVFHDIYTECVYFHKEYYEQEGALPPLLVDEVPIEEFI